MGETRRENLIRFYSIVDELEKRLAVRGHDKRLQQSVRRD
jgi:hypothetical protein